jgi:quinol-cytochrome oxidoreductase complex cytochrome b subunit
MVGCLIIFGIIAALVNYLDDNRNYGVPIIIGLAIGFVAGCIVIAVFGFPYYDAQVAALAPDYTTMKHLAGTYVESGAYTTGGSLR